MEWVIGGDIHVSDGEVSELAFGGRVKKSRSAIDNRNLRVVASASVVNIYGYDGEKSGSGVKGWYR